MLEGLRNEMEKTDTDWFLVFSEDAHLSEYTSESDRYIKALTGFTGSAGTLLAGRDEAYFWTDSRYHVQASKQLEGSGITLMRAGMPSVPSIEDYISEHIWDGQKIAYDLKTISYKAHEKLTRKLPESVFVEDGAKILKNSGCDLPKREFGKIVAVPGKNVGKTTEEKLSSLRDTVKKRYADEKSYTYVLSDITSIMWLFNLRGDDIVHVPAAYSYALITGYNAVLYISRKNLSEEAAKMLDEAGVTVKEYSLFYQDMENIATDMVLADPYSNNSRIISGLLENGLYSECSDPVLIIKAVKNRAEIEGMKEAHIKDAVTMIRFIKYLKETALSGELSDEYMTGSYLDEQRRQNGCIDLSFSTICAYKENAAIVHYSANKEEAKKLAPSGFLLVDSGGQYEFKGTTDITRTISLGPLTDEEKRVYTIVLKGNLRLMAMVFPQGCEGTMLDGIAEQPLWDNGYYCGHGIGHGVGCYLSVHESEARISRRKGDRECAFFPGVIVSDEPGIYLEGRFGVRLENLLLVKGSEEIDGHKMCCFEPLTLVPFDKEAIDRDLLSDTETDILNGYNELIYEKVSVFLDENEKKWLKEYIDIK